MDRQRTLGLNDAGQNVSVDRTDAIGLIHLKLAALGLPTPPGTVRFAEDLIAHYRELSRLLSDHLCPADQRVQDFLDSMLGPVADVSKLHLPTQTLILDRHGLARELSLPQNADHFKNEILESYRTHQGVLHNPRSDRRTTAGVFHVADVGLPVPGDKLAVPAVTYARMLEAALNPPDELMRLPFSDADAPLHTWCTLLLRPVVAPEVPGVRPQKRMETRFFAPGGLVCNLDFVESIFGNAGDPYLPANDAGLDVEHWTGHTGCVILAPHVVGLNKKALGLPHIDQATDRQKRDGMCWTKEDEKYNDGQAFKLTLRSRAGVMVTIISDNYFGYCKKDVKTQISFSANLSGLAEEEHAGGALAFSSFSHGQYFKLDQKIIDQGYTFVEAMKLLGDAVMVHADGYATDVANPSIVYIPENAELDAKTQTVFWQKDGTKRAINLLPDQTYVLPMGYKLRYERHPGAPSWRLVGTLAEGTVCHKPCTVSGGGKSEISKPIGDAIVYGPVYVADVKADLDAVEALFAHDYHGRFRTHTQANQTQYASRPVLSTNRSLGSVIKLLTPSAEYTDEYNNWLHSLPNHVRAIAFIIKRFYDPAWGDDWRSHFTVDEVNGQPGHELKLDGRKLIGSYLRMGFSSAGNWQLYKLRQDFIAAAKVQLEDDITASITLPADMLQGGPVTAGSQSVKLLHNTEARLFQRPDDAVHPGLDRQTEYDMSQPGLFASNYRPMTGADAGEMVRHVASFEPFTDPMKATLRAAAQKPDGYVVCSAEPRIVDGKRTKNPRYLQVRPDIQRPREAYLAELGSRLYRRLPASATVTQPVGAVLCGRRNNPREPGIRPLAVYNPIHYQELPELFMDFISSLTGKSPSTTGTGSEGALTKGPFNALRATADLNNAFLSYVLTGLDGFSSAAGYVGSDHRVDHDVSLLVPEIWCRLRPHEQKAQYLIDHGCLERVKDFEHGGKTIRASRLGWRITSAFVGQFFGRVFDDPAAVFDESMLRPETQSIDDYVDGVENIVDTQQKVASIYLDDGSVEELCPPLNALVHIMAEGTWNGKTEADPAVRAMFSRESVLASDWYQQRLARQQRVETRLLDRHTAYLEQRLSTLADASAERATLAGRLAWVKQERGRVTAPQYVESLIGTIGADGVAG
ncbi:MAG TPA: hypothetical protein VF595_07335 [Tepidisphaeraceae bacterium]|jgi:hypothetical protein